MKLLMKTRYWDDPQARGAFKRFIKSIHGLDLSEWESGGYWDNALTPFSYFDGQEIVSSVCIYSQSAVVNGKKMRLAQISGVGTAPEWRRKGLSRRLTDAGLDWARGRHGAVFLFSNAEAIPFYKACGFGAIDEYVEVLQAKPVPRIPGAVSLDPEKRHDLEKIYNLAKRRTAVSDQFGVLNEKLVVFHSLHSLRNNAYEIPDLNCIVFLERDKGLLKIYDIVGEKVPCFDVLYPFIADERDKLIEFHFHVDKLGLGRTETRHLLGNNPFVRGPFPLKRPVFPYTCRA
jgi:GNAT superfamily N-acetyltransferase